MVPVSLDLFRAEGWRRANTAEQRLRAVEVALLADGLPVNWL